MKMFGITGWSGSGKTTLIRALVRTLNIRSKVVAVVKHTHHLPLFGTPQDQALADAGACETMIVSPERWALLHHYGPMPEWGAGALAARMGGVDLVLVEGFKRGGYPRLEVWDPSLGKPLLADQDASILAVAADVDPARWGQKISWFRRDEVELIAEFVLNNCILVGEDVA